MLTIGTKIGPYEVTAQIGVGGMGEVYRATDTNLKRQVAIKVLPASLAGDAERLARFQREAEVLAFLNHPNIAQIHGLERTDGIVALVMELVEGPTLEEVIAGSERQGVRLSALGAGGSGQRAALSHGQSPKSKAQGLPVDEALRIARQIADADDARDDAGGHDPRHRRLDVARAGKGADGRSARGRLGVRGGALRDAHRDGPTLALSPDGTTLVYVGLHDNQQQLFVRPLNSLDAKAIQGAQGAEGPFFSPDGQWVGFFAQGKLKKAAVAGGGVQVLADAPAPRGGTWAPDDTIYFAANTARGLMRVAASGGTASEVTTVDGTKGETSHRWPHILPGGKALLFSVRDGPGVDEPRSQLSRRLRRVSCFKVEA